MQFLTVLIMMIIVMSLHALPAKTTAAIDKITDYAASKISVSKLLRKLQINKDLLFK